MIVGNSDFPRDLDSITPDWLNSVQSEFFVCELEVEPMAVQGLAASVAVLRIRDGLGKQKSLVVKCSSQNPETRSKFAAYYGREVLFYREISHASNIKVPNCYFAASDGDEHLILLEDMSPALAGDTAIGVDEDFALEFSKVISGLHASWWKAPELVKVNRKLPKFGKSFGVGYSQALRNHADLIKPFSGFSTQKLARELDSGLQRLWDSQWLDPQTIVQWDSHASNVMRPTNSATDWSILDWQNCVVGSGVWDVTRFCVLSLPTEVRRNAEKDIVASYASALAEQGVTIAYDALWASYRRYMPLMFAQQVRFLSSFERHDNTRLAWKEAVMPRVVAALHDAH